MIRKLLFFICISLLFVSTKCFSNPNYVQPTLSFQEGKITGKAYSMIINSNDKVFFFNNKGNCFKVLDIDSKLTKCKISMNYDYICLATQKDQQTTEVMLLDKSAQLKWKKVFPYLVNIAGVSFDGKKVLLQFETQEGSSTIAYLDEKGNEIKIFKNKYIQSVSENGEHWICKDNPYGKVEKIYVYNKGELDYELALNKEIFISTIGNNGNILLKTNDGNSQLFYKDKDKLSNIKYKDHEVFLANNGQVIFCDFGNYVDFLEINQNKTTKRVSQSEIDKITGGSILTFCKLSQIGSIAFFEVSRQKGAINYLYVFKNGTISYLSLELLGNLNNSYSKEFILQDKFLLLKDVENNKFFLFKIQ